jgi:hypothetical protein
VKLLISITGCKIVGMQSDKSLADGEEPGAPPGAEEEPGGHRSIQEHQPLLHQL